MKLEIRNLKPDGSSHGKFRVLSLLFVFGFLLAWTAAAQRYLPGMSAMTPKELRVTLAIDTNGACVLQSETVMSRDMAEKAVRMVEKIKRIQEAMASEESGDDVEATTTSTNAQETLEDADLVAKLKSLYSDEELGGDSERGIALVEIVDQNVRMVMTNAFATPEELVADYEWRQILWGYPVQQLLLETQTNGSLRLTLEPWVDARQTRYLNQMIEQWKKAGVQNELHLVLPGKIVSSSLPVMTNQTTSLTLIATNEDSLTAFRTLVSTSIVVVAESGGLTLSAPVDSSEARMDQYGGGAQQYADLPLQDASPGYVAEADSVQVTTVYQFPEGTNLLRNFYSADIDSAGVEVSGRFFAPKGRTLLAVNKVRVLSAKDDQGRSVVEGSSDESVSGSHAYVSSSDDDPSAQLMLQLGLPEPDASAIEEISAEAEVVSAGSWKELVLTNLASLSDQPVDLSAILAGARVSKIPEKENEPGRSIERFELKLKLEGPREIQSIKVECKSINPGNDNFSVYDYNFRPGKTNATRQISINGYSMFGGTSPDLKSVRVTLKYPADLRREKVAFKLTGMDLY